MIDREHSTSECRFCESTTAELNTEVSSYGSLTKCSSKDECYARIAAKWDFQKIITDYISVNTEERISALADEIQCARSTVRRWASGVAGPHPYMISIVVNVIFRKEKQNESL